MKVSKVVFEFKRGWRFTFTPSRQDVKWGRKYTLWNIIIEKGKGVWGTNYYAFVPSAKICRVLKSSQKYLENPIRHPINRSATDRKFERLLKSEQDV